MFNYKRKKALVNFALFLFTFIFVFSITAEAKKKKEKFANWQEVAMAMTVRFNEATESINNDDYEQAYKDINSAYFDYYEVQGFEANVLSAISRKRVDHIESCFRNIKHVLKGNKEMEKRELLESVENLKVKVYRDAMVLDAVVPLNAEDTVGIAVYGDGEIPDTMTLTGSNIQPATEVSEETSSAETEVEKETKEEVPVVAEVDPAKKNTITFNTTFWLLIREGLEAILVIVAIVAYLVKTGNKHMVKSVYLGSLAAIFASVLLALGIEIALDGSGAARELIEGWTMFLAVIVLFYVSHWMLSKSEHEAWSAYIDGKVQDSIDKKSQWTLVFAAFLAVLREGAELILFYKASFSGGMSDPKYIVYGLLAGTAVLAIVFVIFRFTTVKLPLRPFFVFTSVLLFLMCISFMGKGVIELTEANVIIGSTEIPALAGFEVDILNIKPRAEILIPQVMLMIASVWLLIAYRPKKKISK